MGPVLRGQNPGRVALFAALVAALCFSVVPLLAVSNAGASGSPLWFAAIVSAVSLWPIGAIGRGPHMAGVLSGWSAKQWSGVLATGLLGNGVYHYCFYLAIAAGVSGAGATLGLRLQDLLFPFAAAGFGYAAGKPEPLRLEAVAALVIGALGLVIALGQPSSAGSTSGIVLVFAAAVSGAVYGGLSRRGMTHANNIESLFVSKALAAAGFAAVALAANEPLPSAGVLATAALIGVVADGVGFACRLVAQSNGEPVAVSLVFLSVPILSLVWLSVAESAAPSPQVGIGAAVLLLAVGLKGAIGLGGPVFRGARGAGGLP